MPSNQDRAERASRALEAAYDTEDEGATTCLIDLMTDIRHLCYGTGISFADCLRISNYHYEEEAEVCHEPPASCGNCPDCKGGTAK